MDFLIDRSHFNSLKEALSQLGYEVYELEDNYGRLRDGKNVHMSVDFLFTDGKTLAGMLEAAKKINLNGRQFFVPSLQHLLAMKLHAIKQGGKRRELKDLLDIVELVKANDVDIRANEFRSMCLKYSSPDLYERIVDACGDVK